MLAPKASIRLVRTQRSSTNVHAVAVCQPKRVRQLESFGSRRSGWVCNIKGTLGTQGCAICTVAECAAWTDCALWQGHE